MGLLYLSSTQKIALLNLEKTLAINIANNVIKGIEWTISGALIIVVAAPILYASVSVVKKIIGYDKEYESSQSEDFHTCNQSQAKDNQITDNNYRTQEVENFNPFQGAIGYYSAD